MRQARGVFLSREWLGDCRPPNFGGPRAARGARLPRHFLRRAYTASADIGSHGSFPPPNRSLPLALTLNPLPPSYSLKKNPELGISRCARPVCGQLLWIVILHLLRLGPLPLIYRHYFCFFFFGNSRWQFEIMHPLLSYSGFGAHGQGFAGRESIRSTSVFKH